MKQCTLGRSMDGPFVIPFYEDLEHVLAILPTAFNGISLADSPFYLPRRTFSWLIQKAVNATNSYSHKAGVGCLVRKRRQGLSYMALEEIKVTTAGGPPSSTHYKLVYSTSFIAESSRLMKEMAPEFSQPVVPCTPTGEILHKLAVT